MSAVVQVERPAVVCLDGWSGRVERPVTVVGETPKRYRIRADDGIVKLPGRWLHIGQSTLVPKSAIRFVEAR